MEPENEFNGRRIKLSDIRKRKSNQPIVYYEAPRKNIKSYNLLNKLEEFIAKASNKKEAKIISSDAIKTEKKKVHQEKEVKIKSQTQTKIQKEPKHKQKKKLPKDGQLSKQPHSINQ